MASSKSQLIPNLCKNSTVLTIIVLTELLAVVITILIGEEVFLSSLGVVSLYCQWSILLATAILCFVRSKFHNLSYKASIVIVLLCYMFSYVVTELLSQYILNGYQWSYLDWNRFFSYGVIVLVFAILAVRLFSIFSVIEQRNKSEMSLRMQALQARIRPHFLFNSLNTISELTTTEPKQAEQAIDSLSLLFRASLENDRRFHSLENELNLCKRYIDLERWRLLDRLYINWNVEAQLPQQYTVPKLILQPLIENAIVYGVQTDGRIELKIDIRETKRDLSFVIENVKGSKTILSDGNGIAVDNIRERLFVLYDDQQTFRISDRDGHYSVLMRFPKSIKTDKR